MIHAGSSQQILQRRPGPSRKRNPRSRRKSQEATAATEATAKNKMSKALMRSGPEGIGATGRAGATKKEASRETSKVRIYSANAPITEEGTSADIMIIEMETIRGTEDAEEAEAGEGSEEAATSEIGISTTARGRTAKAVTATIDTEAIGTTEITEIIEITEGPENSMATAISTTIDTATTPPTPTRTSKQFRQ